MCFNAIAIFAALLAIGDPAIGFSLLTPSVYVKNGGSFFQYVANFNTPITNCSSEFVVNATRITFVLDMETISEPKVSSNFVDNTNLIQRVRSLGTGKCGFRLENATSTDPESWTLRSTDDSATFRVLFYESRTMRTTLEVSVGLTAPIQCGSQDDGQGQYFCDLYNPNGQLAMSDTRCYFLINVITIEDLGTWYCNVGVIQSFEVLKYIVDVVETVSTVDGWVNEHDDHVDIGCRLKNYDTTSMASYCKMISPTGQEFVVRPGLAIGRYTTFNTDLQNRVCSMQIAKPLLDSDSGIWKCDLAMRGRMLQVGTQIRYARGSTSVAVELRSMLTVKCAVPYSSTNCFITSPVGARYFPQYPTRAQLGECETTLRADQEHHGIWKCHFFTENNATPNNVNFQVIVTNGLTCTNEVAAVIGKPAEFSCNTGRTPLEYCWFTSPTNETYQLDELVNTTRISYVGRGIQFGDCGIKIDNVLASEIGNWTCLLRMGKDLSAGDSTMILKLSMATGISLAAALGASIGASVAVLIIFGALLYRKWKRNRPTEAETELDERRPSVSSGSSEETFNRI